MAYFKEKIEVIFLPYLKVVIACSLIYAALQLGIRYALPGYEPMTFPLAQLALIAIIALCFIIGYLNRRFQVFSSSKGTLGLVFLTIIAIVCNGMALTRLINEVSYSLTKIDNVDQIKTTPYERYYQIAQVEVRDETIGKFYAATSGKRNTNLTYSYYVVSPMMHKREGGQDRANVFWGMSFSKTLDNRCSDEEKDKIFEAFKQEIDWEMNHMDPGKAAYFERVNSDYDLGKYGEAIDESAQYTGKRVILELSTTPFEQRTYRSLILLLVSYGIPALILLLRLATGHVHTSLIAEIRKRPNGDMLYYPYERK